MPRGNQGSTASPRRRPRVGWLTAAVAAVTMVAGGCAGPSGSAGSIGPGSTAAPGSAAGPGAAGPVATQAPRAPAGTGSSGNGVSIAGHARSVETVAPVSGLSTVHLSGSSVVTGTGDVVDRTGRDLGSGTLRVVGTDVVVSGAGISLASRLRIQPGQVTVNSGAPGGSATLSLSGPSNISAANMTFQPPRPPAPPTSATNGPTTTPPAPPPIPVAGPVRVQPGALEVTGPSLHWVDAPADYHLMSPETELSWAGSGTITTASGPIQADFLGVRAQQVDVTVRRGPGSVDVRGTGLALQAFANGVPQLRTPARVDIVNTHATTGFLGRRRAFVWTPRNLGSTYDMAILRIRPGNPAAGGVHIGLAPMPPMFGGESHALVGGDTSGLKSGDGIDSLIARNGDDRRSIGYDGPAGVQLVLVLEGNFDPIVVSVTTS